MAITPSRSVDMRPALSVADVPDVDGVHPELRTDFASSTPGSRKPSDLVNIVGAQGGHWVSLAGDAGSVAHSIQRILGSGSPAEIIGAIVMRVPVPVRDLMARGRSRAVKCLTDKDMDVKGLASPTQWKLKIRSRSPACRQDASSDTLWTTIAPHNTPRDGADIANARHFVARRIWYGSPFHSRQCLQAAVVGCDNTDGVALWQ